MATSSRPRRVAKKTAAAPKTTVEDIEIPEQIPNGAASGEILPIGRVTWAGVRQVNDEEMEAQEFYVDAWKGNVLLKPMDLDTVLGIMENTEGSLSGPVAMKEIILHGLLDPKPTEMNWEEDLKPGVPGPVVDISQEILRISNMIKSKSREELEERFPEK